MKKLFLLTFFAIAPFVFLSCGTTHINRSDIFGVDESKFTNKDIELFNAVKTRNKDVVKEALEKKINPDVCDTLGQTTLMWASYNGDKEIVQSLLNHRANVNAKNDFKYTALLCAAFRGNKDIFDILLKNGANISDADTNGESVLHKAVKSGNADMLNHVLKKYKEKKIIIDSENSYGYTALHYAIAQRNPQLVEILLDNGKGADPKKMIKLDGNVEIGTIAIAIQSHSFMTFVTLLNDKRIDYSFANEQQGFKDSNGKTLDTEKYIATEAGFTKAEVGLWNEALSQKKNNPTGSVNIDIYRKKLARYYNLVRDDKPIPYDEEYLLYDTSTMYKEAAARKNLLELVVDNGKSDLLMYLLKCGVDWEDPCTGNDVLTYALSRTKYEEKNVRLVEMLINNLGTFSNIIRTDAYGKYGKLPIMHILENQDLIAEKLGEETVMRLLRATESDRSMTIVDDNRKTVFTYAIDLSQTFPFRKKIIDELFSREIYNNPNESAGWPSIPYIHYAYSKQDWYTLNKFFTSPIPPTFDWTITDNNKEDLYTKVQRDLQRTDLPKDTKEELQAIKKRIEELQGFPAQSGGKTSTTNAKTHP